MVGYSSARLEQRKISFEQVTLEDYLSNLLSQAQGRMKGVTRGVQVEIVLSACTVFVISGRVIL